MQQPTRAPDPNAMTLAAFYDHVASTGFVRRVLELARDEDLMGRSEPEPGAGPASNRREGPSGLDVTSAASLSPRQRGRARLIARAGGVIAGLRVIPEIVRVFGATLDVTTSAHDGAAVAPGTVLGEIVGPLDEMLEVERTLLNLVSRLSGVATRTARFVAAIPPGTRAGVYDTRKTTPGLRVLEKYAVRCGGGRSHRMGLFDAVLIKDNHVAGVPIGRLAEFVAGAAERARRIAADGRSGPLSFVEVEVTSLDQFRALTTLPDAGRGVIDIVLLDNMPPAMMRDAAAIRDARAPWLGLEASGGVDLDTIAEIARTGVDRISVGGLTHSAVSLDLALDVVA